MFDGTDPPCPLTPEQAAEAPAKAFEQVCLASMAVVEEPPQELQQPTLNFATNLIHQTSRYLAKRPQTPWVRAVRVTGRTVLRAGRLVRRLTRSVREAA